MRGGARPLRTESAEQPWGSAEPPGWVGGAAQGVELLRGGTAQEGAGDAAQARQRCGGAAQKEVSAERSAEPAGGAAQERVGGGGSAGPPRQGAGGAATSGPRSAEPPRRGSAEPRNVTPVAAEFWATPPPDFGPVVHRPWSTPTRIGAGLLTVHNGCPGLGVRCQNGRRPLENLAGPGTRHIRPAGGCGDRRPAGGGPLAQLANLSEGRASRGLATALASIPEARIRCCRRRRHWPTSLRATLTKPKLQQRRCPAEAQSSSVGSSGFAEPPRSSVSPSSALVCDQRALTMYLIGTRSARRQGKTRYGSKLQMHLGGACRPLRDAVIPTRSSVRRDRSETWTGSCWRSGPAQGWPRPMMRYVAAPPQPMAAYERREVVARTCGSVQVLQSAVQRDIAAAQPTSVPEPGTDGRLRSRQMAAAVLPLQSTVTPRTLTGFPLAKHGLPFSLMSPSSPSKHNASIQARAWARKLPRAVQARRDAHDVDEPRLRGVGSCRGSASRACLSGGRGR